MINNCSDLLQLLQNKEELFQHNYLLITGKVLPYFFFQHIKKVITEKQNIKEWLSGNDYFSVHKLVSLEDTAFFYIPDGTIEDISHQFGIEFVVSDETSFALCKSNFLSIKDKKKVIFLIFIEEKFAKFFSDETLFKVDDMLNNSSGLIFEKYAQNHFDKNFFSLLSYILKIVIHEKPEFAFIEYILFLTRHALSIKKNDIKDFVLSSIEDRVYPLSLNQSIFDLVTFFFQGRRNECLSVWNNVKQCYTAEFWLHFFMNQVWYAFLFVEVKEKQSLKTFDFFKKVNKWFMVSGEKKSPFFQKKKLKEIYIFLYQVDLSAKINETNLLVDLTSFFLLFLK